MFSMIFNSIVIIENIVRIIHRKYIKYTLEINILTEAPIEKNGFPDYDILFQEIKKKVKEELKDAQNFPDDPYKIDFKEISIGKKNQELLPPKDYNHQIANKCYYHFNK